jgi:4-carboxymuconolactone decarboxylase
MGGHRSRPGLVARPAPQAAEHHHHPGAPARGLRRLPALGRRQLEIAILRTGFRCRSGYEWEQHVVFALQAGLTKAEIERIKQGADAPGWSPSDAALIRAADALHDDQFIDDALWGELLAHFSPEQAQDAVFAIAQYTQVAMILNTLGVQLEPGMTLDPDLKAY